MVHDAYQNGHHICLLGIGPMQFFFIDAFAADLLPDKMPTIFIWHNGPVAGKMKLRTYESCCEFFLLLNDIIMDAENDGLNVSDVYRRTFANIFYCNDKRYFWMIIIPIDRSGLFNVNSDPRSLVDDQRLAAKTIAFVNGVQLPFGGSSRTVGLSEGLRGEIGARDGSGYSQEGKEKREIRNAHLFAPIGTFFSLVGFLLGIPMFFCGASRSGFVAFFGACLIVSGGSLFLIGILQ